MTSEIDRKPAKSRNPRNRPDYSGDKAPNPFVNYSMTDDDKAHRDELCPDYSVLMAWLQEALENGQSVSVKYDDYSQSIACFIRPSLRDDENEDLVLTARARSAAGAVREALFLDRERSKGIWRDLRRASAGSVPDDQF